MADLRSQQLKKLQLRLLQPDQQTGKKMYNNQSNFLVCNETDLEISLSGISIKRIAYFQVEPYSGPRDAFHWVVLWRLAASFSGIVAIALFVLAEYLVSCCVCYVSFFRFAFIKFNVLLLTCATFSCPN